MVRKLDSIDMSILENLQKNGRMTNVELADRAGISAPPCLRRLKNLEDSGVIMGYHADLNSPLLGYNFAAICLISLTDQRREKEKEFEERIKELENIRECYSVVGDYNYILKIITKNLADYENFLNTKLKILDNIGQIKTYIAINNNKCEAGVPLNQ